VIVSQDHLFSPENLTEESGEIVRNFSRLAEVELLARMSQLASDLVDTQPLTQETAVMTSGVWGWLLPLAPGIGPVLLQQASHKVGRDPEQADTVATSNLDEERNCSNPRVSRVHFTVFQEAGIPGVRDSSMNGTWVGGMRVGQGNISRLEHCAVISILSPDNRLFVFLDRATMEKQFPAAVTDKYLVGETTEHSQSFTIEPRQGSIIFLGVPRILYCLK